MPNQLRLFILFIGALFIAAAFTFPLWRIAPEVETITEEVIGLNPILQEEFDELPRSIQTLYYLMNGENPAMALQLVEARLRPPEPIIEPLPDVSNAQIIRTGIFQPLTLTEAERQANAELELPPYNGLFSIVGDLQVYAYPDTRYIFRLENFTTVNGPDLVVILSTSPKPFTQEEFGRDYIELGMLKSTTGNFSYMISDININDYSSVVIYDRRYRMIYGFAPLR
jgi:hypothetical protein